MRSFLVTLFLLLLATISFAQQQKEKELESTSKALQFMDKDGACIIKEFYDLESIAGVKCQVLIITDAVANKKIGCLRLETYSSRTDDTYIGTLDFDEIDACVKSLDYLKNTLLTSVPKVYTEAEYKSRDKVSIGAFYSDSKKEWSAFVQTKSYTSRSMKFFDSETLEKLKEQMVKAKEIIAQKTK